LLLWFSPALYAADDLRAYMLAASCTTCHGTDGHSPGSIPALTGKTADYIAGKLTEFKTDAGSPTIMNRLAKGYSEEEIGQIAAWFEAHGQ
jgi:sulfide dehydrogenase cytochrome subunit